MAPKLRAPHLMRRGRGAFSAEAKVNREDGWTAEK